MRDRLNRSDFQRFVQSYAALHLLNIWYLWDDVVKINLMDGDKSFMCHDNPEKIQVRTTAPPARIGKKS